MATRMGLSIGKSCDYAGITYSAFNSYMKKADEDKELGLHSKATKFVEEYNKAKAEFIMKHVVNITTMGDTNWQASAWMLERRCPEDFALQAKVDTTIQRIEVVNDIPKNDDSN